MTDEVIVNGAVPGGDTQEHIDAMVAKAAGTSVDAEGLTADDPNAGIKVEPGAGDNPEEQTPEQKAEAEAAEQKAVEDEADASAVLESAGLDVEAVIEQINTDGELTTDQYDALAKVGISKAVVDTYIAGQAAASQAFVTNMGDAVGGEENLNNILGWAAEGLTPAEIEQFNQTIETGSEAGVRMAIKGLQMRYNEAGQNAPSLVGGRHTEQSASVYRSHAELTKAMGDPRYATDEAYRNDVMAKLARSNVF